MFLINRKIRFRRCDTAYRAYFGTLRGNLVYTGVSSDQTILELIFLINRKLNSVELTPPTKPIVLPLSMSESGAYWS